MVMNYGDTKPNSHCSTGKAFSVIMGTLTLIRSRYESLEGIKVSVPIITPGIAWIKSESDANSLPPLRKGGCPLTPPFKRRGKISDHPQESRMNLIYLLIIGGDKQDKLQTVGNRFKVVEGFWHSKKEVTDEKNIGTGPPACGPLVILERSRGPGTGRENHRNRQRGRRVSPSRGGRCGDQPIAHPSGDVDQRWKRGLSPAQPPRRNIQDGLLSPRFQIGCSRGRGADHRTDIGH